MLYEILGKMIRCLAQLLIVTFVPTRLISNDVRFSVYKMQTNDKIDSAVLEYKNAS